MVAASGRLLELLVEVKVEDGVGLPFRVVGDLDLDGIVVGLLSVEVRPLGVARLVY
jgi:hypothetical protein